MIRTVIRINNNMVMVFDEEGEQIPWYQGDYDDVRERILADASPGSVLQHWFGRSPEPQVVPSEVW